MVNDLSGHRRRAGSYFAFTVGHPARPATRWDYRLEPAGEGSTKVTESSSW